MVGDRPETDIAFARAGGWYGVLVLSGVTIAADEGIAAAGGRVFSEVHGDTVLVVVVNEAGGDLSFDVSLADTTRPPTGALVEVSGPDDRIRVLTGYSLEIRR